MLKIIPAINTNSFEELQNKIKSVEPYVEYVQIDVADGTFTKNTIWHNPGDLLLLQTKVKIEVHLMVNEIEKRVEDWFLSPVNRIIFHLETAKDPYFVIQKCREAEKEVGIAIGPDTPWTQLMPLCGKVDLFQILSVYPGLAGQKFIQDSLEKISDLRKNCPNATIEVDGGLNKETAKECAKAGANIINAASYIFNNKNIKKAIEELKNE